MTEYQLFLQENLNQIDLKLKDNVLTELIEYLSDLLIANQRINLTSITDWREAIIKHLVDSLLILKTDYWQNAEEVMDVGTGPGFPGIPLAFSNRDRSIYLLEANRKKAGFLHEVKEKYELSNVQIISDRAELAAYKEEYRENFDLVTARAVAALPTLLELTTPFCKVGGVFVAYKGPEITEEIASAQNALTYLGVTFIKAYTSDLPHGKGRRNLVVYKKTAPTQEKYPRRPGIPSKKPLI
jgi:16S rRNA (guanine527-N7)-methyltransferase